MRTVNSFFVDARTDSTFVDGTERLSVTHSTVDILYEDGTE